MSRSGYTEDTDDQWAHIRWRGAVVSSIRGARGQAFLAELLAALDAMPEKRLVRDELVSAEGEFCALGVVGQRRGLQLGPIDPEDSERVAAAFGIAEPLAREIVFENDEYIDDTQWVEIDLCGPVRPYFPDWGRRTRSVEVPVIDAAERRWQHMRDWVANRIRNPRSES